MLVFLFLFFICTDRVSRDVKAVGSDRLSLRLFPLYFLNRMTFEPEYFSVCGS